MNIYLICTGNTCRSPMAEAILRSKEIDNVQVRSAGIYAQNGIPIAANAKTLIEQNDMPFTPFSRAISNEDIEWADLILTMTRSHKLGLIHLFPETVEKTFTLKEFAESDGYEDIHDPFGGDLETYRYTFNDLTNTIDALERKLMEGQA